MRSILWGNGAGWKKFLNFLLLHIEGSYEKYIRENEKFQSIKEYSPAE